MCSILLASQGQLTIACGLIFLAALFDVFDGLAARALGGGTPLGAQLDSLADMVSFGVSPAFILIFRLGWPFEATGHWTMLAPLLIPIASAWRLAKFNIDTRQTAEFLGLATPANALFWCSMVLASLNVAIIDGPGVGMIYHLLTFGSSLGLMVQVVVLVLCILMLSELPLPSLKFKHKGWKGNEVIFLLIGIGTLLVVLYGILAVPLILVLYLLSPLWGRLFPKGT